MKKTIIGICQIRVRENKSSGLARAEDLIVSARDKGAQLVVLPEMWNCPYDIRCFKAYAESVPDGESCRLLSSLARRLKIHIVGGSIPESDRGRIYNSAPVFNPQGKLIALHRKVHLFDVNLRGVRMRESAVLSAGNRMTVFGTPFGRFGLLICYDARFPEMLRQLLRHGAETVIIPGAFSKVTGEAHWHALMRMRAVDNQVFVAAASPARDKKASYQAFGHSLVSDPWGGILAEAGTGESVILAELNPKTLSQIRTRLPLLAHRRPDLY